QIYKASFQPPDEVQIAIVRDKGQDERDEGWMMFSRLSDGRRLVYRACDRPEDGVEIDASSDELKECELKAIHRDKLIYLKCAQELSARAISPNIIIITNPIISYPVFAKDESPFIYFCLSNRLWILDTITMEFHTF
ncbi:hypothetical protein PFISCL1PPCAC_13439, partial [Pristionchus fissidentatus]